MIAIGGSIGTGLFVASGATISQAGRAALFCYDILIDLMVCFLMTSLGSWRPICVQYLARCDIWSELCGRRLWFRAGLELHWYNWAVTIAVDTRICRAIGHGLVVPGLLPGWIWALFLCVIFLAELHFRARFWRGRSTGSR